MAFEFQFRKGFSPSLFGPLFPHLSNGDAELWERTQALIVKVGQCCVSVGYKGYRKRLPLFLESHLSLCTWTSALDQTSGETSSAPPSSSNSSANSTGSRPLCTGQTE